MNLSYKLLLLAFLALPAGVSAAGTPGTGVTTPETPGAEEPIKPGAAGAEKKRSILKIYDVDANDQLTVDNQFGQVKVGLWDKKEIRIQITITANASSDERMQEFLDAVEIEEKRNGNQISLRTDLAQRGSGWNFTRKADGSGNYVRIDYDVQMPRQNALTVRNKFGNTEIPAFSAPLSVYQRYGNFNANDLSGNRNDIDVAFGNANIRQMEQGKVECQYGNLDLDRATVLTLINKFGKMKIGDVGRLDANIGYSGARIGTLRQNARIKLDFSGGFRIDQLAKTADDVDIQANYSSVALPMTETSAGDFDVIVKYGGFNYSSSGNIRLTAQPDGDNRYGPRMTKQYSGKIGNGNGVKIRVISSFGSVNFK